MEGFAQDLQPEGDQQSCRRNLERESVEALLTEEERSAEGAAKRRKVKGDHNSSLRVRKDFETDTEEDGKKRTTPGPESGAETPGLEGRFQFSRMRELPLLIPNLQFHSFCKQTCQIRTYQAWADESLKKE